MTPTARRCLVSRLDPAQTSEVRELPRLADCQVRRLAAARRDRTRPQLPQHAHRPRRQSLPRPNWSRGPLRERHPGPGSRQVACDPGLIRGFQAFRVVELLRLIDGIPVVIGRGVHSGLVAGIYGLGLCSWLAHMVPVPPGPCLQSRSGTTRRLSDEG